MAICRVIARIEDGGRVLSGYDEVVKKGSSFNPTRQNAASKREVLHHPLRIKLIDT